MIIDFKNSVLKKRCVFMDLESSSLSNQRKEQIEKVVDGFLSDVDFGKTPYIDIVSIVQKDGFVVETHEMDIETTGCLFVDETDKDNPSRSIWVNTVFKNPDNEEDVVFKKSRFITAHEYGHYKLHHTLRAHRDTYHRKEQIELEADYFARSILMPLEYFRTCYKTLSDFSSNDREYVTTMLSKFFKVTKNKVNLRIQDLDELKCV